MTRTIRHAAVAALAAVTVLAACGSSEDDGGGASDTTAAASDTTAAAGRGAYDLGGGDSTAAPGPATTAAGAAAPASGAGAVSIAGFAFDPAELSVAAGTTVTWTNDDDPTHRIASDDGSFDSEDLANGDTFEHTFDTAGTFEYICSIHPSMKGTVTVTG